MSVEWKVLQLKDLTYAISAPGYVTTNICWSSRLLGDVLSRRVLKTSSKRLQRNNFLSSKTSWRRLEGVLQVGRRLERRKIVTLKTSWRRLEGMSWARLGDKQNVYWEYLYLANINLYLINLYLTYLHLTNQGESKTH